MLNEISAMMYIGSVYALIFPVGYLFLQFKGFKKFHTLPFFVRLPIYLALGLSMYTLVYLLVGLIVVNTYVSVITFLLTSSFVLYLKRRDVSRLTKVKFYSPSLSFDNTFPLLLFSITFFHFSQVVGYMMWPPPGDLLSHGLITSLILHHQKIPTTQDPIASVPIQYPAGFRIVAAYLSALTGLYPGEAVFLLGGATIALIPSILYSLTYINTRSKTFSLLAYLSSFLIHPSGHLEKWIVGYFYNGPYPSLCGFLSIFTFCALISLKRLSQSEASDLRHIYLISSFVWVQLALTYPSFSLFILAYLATMGVKELPPQLIDRFQNVLKHGLFTKKGLMITLSLMSSLFLCYIFQNQIRQLLRLGLTLIPYKFESLLRYLYRIPLVFLYDSVVGIAILVAAVVAVFFVAKAVYVDVSLFYLIVFIPLMLSLSDHIHPYMSLLLPSRSIMINAGLSWVLLAIFLNLLMSKIWTDGRSQIKVKLLKKQFTAKLGSKLLANVIILTIALSLFLPTMTSHLSLREARKWGWFSLQWSFKPDFEALEWINENVPPEDLILNDMSFSSFYLMSLSIKNLTFIWNLQNRPVEEYLEIKQIWESPENYALVRQIIEKYEIRYVLVTSEWGYYDGSEFGGDFRYKPKPRKPEEYISIFNKYPFLEPVFRSSSGNTAVYKVV